ncbi:MAG: chromosomal replication initiator protein DnaA, partial [Patescibacteria group bacterium]
FIADFDQTKVIVGVPNTFTKAWLEKKYHRDILDSLRNITEQDIRLLEYRVETRSVAPMPVVLNPGEEIIQPEPVEREDFGFTTTAHVAARETIAINNTYTFDTFIVGKQNELAHAASQAVAAQPGGTYNPLFIYGGVGLGKTHLLHSVGNEVLSRNPDARILYVTCEHFTNDFIQAVRSGKAKEFKDRYRTVDLLLIDDIQFITGKEGTQEEFFHTFNTLHQENKQIVISSDRPPKAIASLEKRLLSRLEWGMLVDVGAPDLETRIAILGIKCQERGVALDRDILHFVASNINSNVRELEGALNKIVAFHQFKNISPTVETVKPLIASFDVNNIKKTLSPKQIIHTVAEYFDIHIEDVLGKSREKRLAFPRQIIMFLLREEMKSSYPTIGSELGGRDHTTAMHAFSKISRMLKEDEQLKRDLELIKQKLYSR